MDWNNTNRDNPEDLTVDHESATEPTVASQPGAAELPVHPNRGSSGPAEVEVGTDAEMPTRGEALSGSSEHVTEDSRLRLETSEPTERTPELTRPSRTMRHIKNLARVSDGSESGTTVVRNPSESRVAAAFHAGKKLQAVFRRKEQAGPTTFLAHEELVPDKADDHQVEVEVDKPVTPQTQQGMQTVEPAASKEPTHSQFSCWLRLSAERCTPKAGATSEVDDPRQPKGGDRQYEDGLTIEDFIDSCDQRFEVVVQGEGVDAKTNRRLIEEVDTALRTARGVEGWEQHVRTLEHNKAELEAALQGGLAHRSVVIGASSTEELSEIAHRFVSVGLKSGDQTRWTAKLQPDNIFTSVRDALAAGKSDVSSYVSAKQFCDELAYPERQVTGLGMYPFEQFAVNRTNPPGSPTTRLGNILNAAGTKIVGHLDVAKEYLRRHTIMVGSTGAGKTTAVRNILSNIALENHKQRIVEAAAGVKPLTGRPNIVVDFGNEGNYTDKLYREMAAKGIPPEEIKIYRVNLASGANVNLLRLTGKTKPLEQMTVAVQTLVLNMEGKRDAESIGVYEKYLTMAIRRAYEKVGWNMDTNEPLFAGTTPPQLTMDVVKPCIVEVVGELRHKSEDKGSLGSYSVSNLEKDLMGAHRMLFRGGNDIDFDVLMQMNATIIFELGDLGTLAAKRLAMNGIFNGTINALQALRPDDGDIDETLANLFMEEATGIFQKDTAVGEHNAHRFTNARGLGLQMWLVQQGGLNLLADDVGNNASNILVHLLNNPADKEWVAKRIQIPAPKLLAFLSAGMGIYYGPDMPDGPVRIQAPPPARELNIPAEIRTPHAFLDKGYDRKFYEPGVRSHAEQLLLHTKEGNLVQATAELTTALTLTGHEPVIIGGQLLAKLKAAKGIQADQLDCAITQAAKLAVHSRREILGEGIDQAKLIRFVTDSILSQIRDDVPTPQKGLFEFVVKSARYNLVKNRLKKAMTADPLPNTERYSQAFGRHVGGITAREQWNVVRDLERQSLKNLTAVVVGANGEPLTKPTIDTAATELRRLTNSLDTADIIGLIEAGKQDALTEPELQAISAILSHAQSVATPSPTYQDMRVELERAVNLARYAPTPPLSDLEDAYEERFQPRPGQTRPGGLAYQKLDTITELEKTYLAGLPDDAPSLETLLFAEDLLRGQVTLDNNVHGIITANKHANSLTKALVRALNDGQLEDHTLVHVVATGLAEDEWMENMGTAIVTGLDIYMSPPATEAVTECIQTHRKHLPALREKFKKTKELTRS